MNTKKIFCLVFFLGCLVLSAINICAKETTTTQKQSVKNIKSPIQYAKEKVKAGDFTDNLFIGLEENDIVFQVDGGGFLCSTTMDSEAVKKGFEELNKGVKLKAATVSEAKEFYRKQMDKYWASQKKR